MAEKMEQVACLVCISETSSHAFPCCNKGGVMKLCIPCVRRLTIDELGREVLQDEIVITTPTMVTCPFCRRLNETVQDGNGKNLRLDELLNFEDCRMAAKAMKSMMTERIEDLREEAADERDFMQNEVDRLQAGYDQQYALMRSRVLLPMLRILGMDESEITPTRNFVRL